MKTKIIYQYFSVSTKTRLVIRNMGGKINLKRTFGTMEKIRHWLSEIITGAIILVNSFFFLLLQH